jgi:hypothetical protein
LPLNGVEGGKCGRQQCENGEGRKHYFFHF